MEASVFVRDNVHHGYRIPFLATPAPVFRYNHQSTLQNEQFVSELDTGSCVLPQAECPLVCSPLSVVQSGKGKRRLVITLHYMYLNQYLPEQKLKYESESSATHVCSRGLVFHL